MQIYILTTHLCLCLVSQNGKCIEDYHLWTGKNLLAQTWSLQEYWKLRHVKSAIPFVTSLIAPLWKVLFPHNGKRLLLYPYQNLPWICNFMSNRSKRVRYQGYLSDWEYPSYVVAQGTILGPIIFQALINNALQDQIDPWKYVDNMTIAQKRTPHHPCTLQQTLNELGIWVEEHKMKLNSKKCKVLHVTRIKQIPAWKSFSIDPNILKNLWLC